MAVERFGVNHPLVVKLWSRRMDVEALKETFYARFIVNDRGIGTPYFRVKGTPCLGAEKGTPGSARSGEAGRGCTA